MRLARRHRVAGLVHRGIGAAALPIPPALANERHRLVARNLLLIDEAARLSGLLTASGLPHLFLKGAALGQLAYGDQTIKQTLDNDLLISLVDVPAALGLLNSAGYELSSPPGPMDSNRLPVLIDMVKECTLVHADNHAVVDLHWRAVSIKGLVAEPDLARDVRHVTVAGHALPTLREEQLMVYLAVHGARHGWARLKWLADFNAILAAMDDQAIAALRVRARRDGVQRAMDLALFQVARIFGVRVPADVGRSRRVRWLVALSDSLMRGRDELAGQADAPWRYMLIGHASALLLKTTPRYLANVAWSSWVSTADALALPLPRAARPLYLLTSPAARIGRAARRIVDRGFSRTAQGPMRARQEK